MNAAIKRRVDELEAAAYPKHTTRTIEVEYSCPDTWGTESWVSRHLGYGGNGNVELVENWRRVYPDFPNGRPDNSGPFDEWVNARHDARSRRESITFQV